jgi:hypothetical protein
MSANTTHGRSPGRRENVDSIYRFALFHRCLREHSPQHFRAGHRLYIIIRPTAPPTTKWNHRVLGIIKEEHYYSTMYSSIGKRDFWKRGRGGGETDNSSSRRGRASVHIIWPLLLSRLTPPLGIVNSQNQTIKIQQWIAFFPPLSLSLYEFQNKEKIIMVIKKKDLLRGVDSAISKTNRRSSSKKGRFFFWFVRVWHITQLESRTTSVRVCDCRVMG